MKPKIMRCFKCHHQWHSPRADTECVKCGHLYVLWVNYEADWAPLVCGTSRA